jgi:hypothetical protein
MKSGGLLVYAPVAPTEECIALVNELNAPVEYILLPTTLFEHKLFMGPFQVRPTPYADEKVAERHAAAVRDARRFPSPGW